jgi:hypothetical protein
VPDHRRTGRRPALPVPLLTQANGDPFPTQDWEVKRVNDNGITWYSDQLTNPTSGLVVDVSGSSYRPGAAVIGWPRHDDGFGTYSLNQVFEQYEQYGA